MKPSYAQILKSASILLEYAQNPTVSDFVITLVSTRLDEIVHMVQYVSQKLPMAKLPAPANYIKIVEDAPKKEKAAPKASPKSKKGGKVSRSSWCLTPAEIEQAKQLLAAGNSMNRVAGILGRSWSGLRYALERNYEDE